MIQSTTWQQQWPGVGVERENAQIAGHWASLPTPQKYLLTLGSHFQSPSCLKPGFAFNRVGPFMCCQLCKQYPTEIRLAAMACIMCGSWKVDIFLLRNYVIRTGIKARVGLERKNKWQCFIFRYYIFNCKITGGACQFNQPISRSSFPFFLFYLLKSFKRPLLFLKGERIHFLKEIGPQNILLGMWESTLKKVFGCWKVAVKLGSS